MPDWGTWAQLAVTAGLSSSVTGVTAVITTRSNQRSAAITAGKNRAHELEVTKIELESKRTTDVVSRAADVVTECVSELTAIEVTYLTPMHSLIAAYERAHDQIEALEPYFSGVPGSPESQITDRERQKYAADSAALIKQQFELRISYEALHDEAAPKLAALDLLLTRASLLTSTEVARKTIAVQDQLTSMRCGLRDRIIDEDMPDNLDTGSLRQAKVELIDAARSWMTGEQTRRQDDPGHR